MNRQELAIRLLEHLAGKHNQKSHGRRKSGKADGGLVTVAKKDANPDKGSFKIPTPAQVAAKNDNELVTVVKKDANPKGDFKIPKPNTATAIREEQSRFMDKHKNIKSQPKQVQAEYNDILARKYRALLRERQDADMGTRKAWAHAVKTHEETRDRLKA